MTTYTGNLTTTQYRVDAVPYDTEADALAAIMEHKVSNPEDTYSVRQYRNEGFYILIQFEGGGSRWLTPRKSA